MESASYGAAMKTAASEAATMETASAAHAASVAATAAASATTRQRHGWRGQTNRHNCQQRDHCLTQHCHSPSRDIAQPRHSSQVAIGPEKRYWL
jgi:hypothetical protein